MANTFVPVKYVYILLIYPSISFVYSYNIKEEKIITLTKSPVIPKKKELRYNDNIIYPSYILNNNKLILHLKYILYQYIYVHI